MENCNINQILINPQAVQVCQRLQEAGFQAFIVGGCVRDLLLQKIPKDWDITTNATPQQVMSLFPKHYATGLQHGTITVSMGEGIENHFEVTTFRVEGEYKDGRRPEEVLFVSKIEEDLARRDLTFNAIALDPISYRLVDPFRGIEDLCYRVVKAVGVPLQRFQEDGLRIMRAARFAARFNCTIEEATLQAMSESLDTLKKVSMERIKDELCKILMTNNPKLGISLLIETGAIDVVCPILNNKYLTHFLENINKCQGELETRLACLYFNVQTNFVEQELLRLKFSNKEIKKTLLYFKLLDVIMENSRDVFIASESIYIKIVAKIKNESPEWESTLKEFITLTDTNYPEVSAMLRKHQDVTVLSRQEMNINGTDLIELGIKPGPQIKEILDHCYEVILQNPALNNKADLLCEVLK